MKFFINLLLAPLLLITTAPACAMESLLDATMNNNIALVKQLIANGAAIGANNDGSTPLHYVAVWGGTDIAKLLIKAKATIDAKDGGGNTPLHWVALLGETDMA
ncbi:unnamed protein product, partial [marine sediment metagenome]